MIALLMLAEVIVGTAGGWEIVEGKNDCSARADYQDGTAIEFGPAHSTGWSSLVMWNERWRSIVADKKYTIRIQFDNAASSYVQGEGMKTSDAGGLFVSWDDTGVLPEAMIASRLKLWNGSNFIGAYDLKGSAAAVRSVARCSGRANVRPKADPFAAPDAPELPTGMSSASPISRWVTADDYPSNALREEKEGTSTLKIGVDRKGLVQSCVVAASSGSTDLDEAACRAVSRRARYEAGAPKTTTEIVQWQIPRN
jgi:TonB family protein